MINKSNPFVAGVVFGIAASAALVCVFAASSQSQSPPAKTTAPPAVRAPSGPITPASEDDAQALALFTQFVGTWDVQGVATSADGKTSGPFRGESQFGWILGGNFLSGDHVLWNTDGAALQSIDLMGFTPGVGFTRSEITNGDRSMFLSTGMHDDAARALTFVTSNSLTTVGGKPRSMSTTFMFGFDGSIIWDTQFQIDDEPAGSVKLTLTRTSAVPGISTPNTPHGAPMTAQGADGNAGTNSGSFIVQTPQGLAVTRAPQTAAENQQLMSAMMKQRQQMQAQMNTMQGQVSDMSRTMNGMVQ
ncbi:MAG: hypothetical protein O2875_08250 [Planctomycetota bacterium]|nr:hypothetical protein [Planctomycetota bacterium]MDA1261381.1 hypothetical protein [Planctomycetota bacterium]